MADGGTARRCPREPTGASTYQRNRAASSWRVVEAQIVSQTLDPPQRVDEGLQSDWGGTVVAVHASLHRKELTMNKALCISAAVAMALSAAAYAKGGAQSKSSASSATTESAQFTEKDCQMLSVPSARAACMQSAVRSNGGIDAAAVARTTGGTTMGQGTGATGGASANANARSNAGIDPSAVGGTSSSGAMTEGRMKLKSEAGVTNSSPDTYNVEHR